MLSLNLCGCSIYIYEIVMKIMILMLMIIIAMMLAKVVAVLEGWSLKQRCCSWHKRWCMVTVTHFTSFLGFPPLLKKNIPQRGRTRRWWLSRKCCNLQQEATCIVNKKKWGLRREQREKLQFTYFYFFLSVCQFISFYSIIKSTTPPASLIFCSL